MKDNTELKSLIEKTTGCLLDMSVCGSGRDGFEAYVDAYDSTKVLRKKIGKRKFIVRRDADDMTPMCDFQISSQTVYGMKSRKAATRQALLFVADELGVDVSDTDKNANANAALADFATRVGGSMDEMKDWKIGNGSTM